MDHCGKCGAENKWKSPKEPSLYPWLVICNSCGELYAKRSPSSGWGLPSPADRANMRVLHGEGWFFLVHRSLDMAGFLAHTEKGKLIAISNPFCSEFAR